jgi:hypothetical protein
MNWMYLVTPANVIAACLTLAPCVRQTVVSESLALFQNDGRVLLAAVCG